MATKAKETVNVIGKVARQAKDLFDAKIKANIADSCYEQVKGLIAFKAADYKNVAEYTENDMGNGTVLCVTPPYTAHITDKDAVVNYLTQHGLLDRAIANGMVKMGDKLTSRITLSKQSKDYIEDEVRKFRLPVDLTMPELCRQYIDLRTIRDNCKETVRKQMDDMIRAIGHDDMPSCSVQDESGNKTSFFMKKSLELDVDRLMEIIPKEDHNIFKTASRNIQEPIITVWDAMELEKFKAKTAEEQGKAEPPQQILDIER